MLSTAISLDGEKKKDHTPLVENISSIVIHIMFHIEVFSRRVAALIGTCNCRLEPSWVSQFMENKYRNHTTCLENTSSKPRRPTLSHAYGVSYIDINIFTTLLFLLQKELSDTSIPGTTPLTESVVPPMAPTEQCKALLS
jgi:hypothetical protein